MISYHYRVIYDVIDLILLETYLKLLIHDHLYVILGQCQYTH